MCIRDSFIESNNLHTLTHDLPHFGIDKIDNARKDFLLLNGLIRGHLDCIGEFIHRDIDLFLTHSTVDQVARTNQQAADRTEQYLSLIHL